MRAIVRLRIGLPHRARGVALLALLACMSVVVLGLLLGILNRGNPRAERDAVTARAMAAAKQGLLDWAASNNSLPGQLPCPEDVDPTREGWARVNCTPPVTGRLPWRTLGLPDLRDANRDKLWYALSAGFRNAPINSATPASLTVDGTNSAVAIVFSPGPALAGQNRDAGPPPVLSNYLELANNGGTSAFVTTGAAGAFNDKLLVVTKKDLMRVVEARVAGEVTIRLRAFFQSNFFFPYAAPATDGACTTSSVSGYLSLVAGNCSHPAFPGTLTAPLDRLPDWYAASNWEPYLTYQLAAGCVQSTPGAPGPSGAPDCGGAGRLTVDANPAVKASVRTPNNRAFLVQ